MDIVTNRKVKYGRQQESSIKIFESSKRNEKSSEFQEKNLVNSRLFYTRIVITRYKVKMNFGRKTMDTVSNTEF